MIRTALAVLCATAIILAGCAKVGTLDRPAPLFGEKAKAEFRAQKAAEAAAKAPKPEGEPEPLPADLTTIPAAAAPPEANPPVSGQSNTVNGQPEEPPASPTLPPVAPQ